MTKKIISFIVLINYDYWDSYVMQTDQKSLILPELNTGNASEISAATPGSPTILK